MNTPTADKADETRAFTEQEFQFMFGICRGLPLVKIAEQCKIDHSIVMNTVLGIYRKVGVSTRLEFVHHFVRAALNAELRRRSGRAESA
jgi:DNA-binding NarL/FixJ family response regulator